MQAVASLAAVVKGCPGPDVAQPLTDEWAKLLKEAIVKVRGLEIFGKRIDGMVAGKGLFEADGDSRPLGRAPLRGLVDARRNRDDIPRQSDSFYKQVYELVENSFENMAKDVQSYIPAVWEGNSEQIIAAP